MKMRAVVIALAIVAAVGGIAGCNDDQVPAGAPGATAPTTVATAPGAPGTAVATTLPTRDDANVDARDFAQGDQFYFQSPSGNIMCGFINTGGIGVGCQLAQVTSVPAELPGCGYAENKKVAAEIFNGAPRFRCLSQGMFVGSPTDGSNKGGGKILRYGETIIVRGTACTSMESGVRCDTGGRGFVVAAEAQSLF
ncbi:hypothetical protein [Nocardia sp. NPDC057668]|uniref:hypothetical protein n=1 Tax=Nocardia sp. NPDC057668 TaxID=3346202 RepID=UPI0036725E20